ncbi:mechanosensitive ion channel domain-containing protein [Aporhodopirellula aestuarii]|uniref:Mechanosensitive ion channel n=1 Tax=Aporhodopirellula aestuarii TaxID=2950107 RepID=A0ABT0U030_9BACT|nr:mechanosensitive ion channel domain-containing protein [Aporhodopirellula aestuarii]MCM2370176.1 mechanosensitive ion channel [Aporhodopirellula aestuarii]
MRSTRFVTVTAVLSLVCFTGATPWGTSVLAQEGVDVQPSTSRLQEKSEYVASELRIAMLQEEQAKPSGSSDGEPENASNADVAPRETTQSNVDLLKQIDVVIAQQKTANATLQDLQASTLELEAKLNRLDLEGVEEGPPYSITLLDEIGDALAASKGKRDALEATILAARETVERAKQRVDAAEKSRRQWKESGGTDLDPNARSYELEVQLAKETLVLSRQQLAIEQASEKKLAVQTRIDEKRWELVRPQVLFSKQTLDAKIAELNVKEKELKQRLALIASELEHAKQRRFTARQELDGTLDPSMDLVERVEALTVVERTVQVEQTIVNQRLQRLPMIRTSWQRRYFIATGQAKRDEERQWLEEVNEQLQEVAREKQTKLLKLLETRETQSAVAARIDALGNGDAGVRRWLDTNYQSLSKQVEFYNSAMLGLDSAARTLGRLRFDIEGAPSRSLGEWVSDGWAWLGRIWTYELTNIDDTSITVGKIASSLLFILFGYFAARVISSLLGNRLPKFGVAEAGADAIESLAFYSLMTLFALAALKYANVPLTVFTFLGGAIAIGVGFGSQNILNNFISGLILLAERPIRAGDLILVDDTYGNVKTIGARSTTIRTGENLDIIIPNSKFLENNVINLTRRDDRLRTSISVGVAYGSPLEEVMRLLELAAAENDDVNDRPKPFVWFNDFGDNALAFQLHFWINARTVSQMRKIETEVRLSIDRLFREHDIVIAFPQRDLHLRSQSPIEFKLVGDSAKSK